MKAASEKMIRGVLAAGATANNVDELKAQHQKETIKLSQNGIGGFMGRASTLEATEES